MTDAVNSNIKELAKRDYKVKCIIGENDLIADEAHYYKTCYIKAERQTVTKQPDTR